MMEAAFVDIGFFEIGTAGMREVLARIDVDRDLVTLEPGAVVFSFDYGAYAIATGVPAEARVRNTKGEDVISGLQVGPEVFMTGLKNGRIERGMQVVIEEFRWQKVP